jgi:hypothetical protein
MRSPSHLARRACWGFVAAFALQSLPAQAVLIGAEAAVPDPVQQDREKVQQFLDRATVQDRLKAMGVDGLNAQRRVDAMTHEEVHALAQRIDILAAGGALSDRDLILLVLIVLLVAVVI